MADHTPTPWLREDCTVYSLNRFDANRFNCTVQPGFDEYDQRASAAECEANAALIVKAVNAHDELVAALKAAALFIKNFHDLVSESSGVGGLHLNGDFSPWDELLPGGRFEDWLGSIEPAETAIDSALSKIGD